MNFLQKEVMMAKIDMKTLKVGDIVIGNSNHEKYKITAIGDILILYRHVDKNGELGPCEFSKNKEIFPVYYHFEDTIVEAWFPVCQENNYPPFIVSVKHDSKEAAEGFISAFPEWKTIGAAKATWISEEPVDVRLAC
jgi:hypothetical protein